MSTKLRDIQTSFESGQIDATAIARRDITLFETALKDATNWRMTSTGAIQRRFGSTKMNDLGSTVRLIPFQFDQDNVYILALEAGQIRFYDSAGTLLQTTAVTQITTLAQAWNLSFIQSGDFMFLAHRDMPTLEIQRTSATTFTVNLYIWDIDDDLVKQAPFNKYAPSNMTILISGAGPYVLTTSANYWTADYFTNTVQVKVTDQGVDMVFEVSGFTSATQVPAVLRQSSAAVPAVPTAVKTWTEESINGIHGFPQAVCFHAGRLWFAGMLGLPAHIIGSRIGLFWNFDVGTGADDHAIFAPVDSDRVNSIRSICSGQHLQIFTDLSELYLSEDDGVPLTPSTVAVRTSTRYGANYMRPLVFDDATLFVQARSATIREYLWNSLNRGYTSNPLSLLANDIINAPVQSAIDYGGEPGPEQYAYFVNGDGTMAVYHALRSEEIRGFMSHTTQGEVESVAVVGEELWMSVKRQINSVDTWFLEKQTKLVFIDCAQSDSDTPAKSLWTGFTDYADQLVHVTSENNQYYLGEYLVSATGEIDLSVNNFTATQIWVGFNYTATAETLPLNFTLPKGPTEQLPKRLVSGFIRVDSSYDFEVNGRVFSPRYINQDVSEPPVFFTGNKRAYFLGAAFDKTLTVISDIPLDCTLLSMGVEVGI